MKVIKLYGIDDLRLEDQPEPAPIPGTVRIRTACVGVCGSDVHYLTEGGTGGALVQRPLILGHEFSAWIDEGPNQGQLVTIDPALPCGRCEFCLEGNPNLCIDLKYAGSDETDGGFQEVLAWPEHAIYPLPEGITPQQGAMLEPFGIALHALRLGKVSPGMDVGVFGAGPIGLLTIQLAKLAGASRIFATDLLPHRLTYAQTCGATDVFLADGTEARQIADSTAQRGLDVAFEAAGDDGSAVETAVMSAKRGADLVLIGIPSSDETRFTASTARRRGLTIKLVRRMKNTYPTAIRLIARGQVNLNPLITHIFSMDDYQEAFQVARSRAGIKVLIDFAPAYPDQPAALSA